MKYILLFASTQVDNEAAAARMAKLSQEEKIKASEPFMKWFEENGRAGKVVGGEELHGIETAKTLRVKGGKAVVTDGPFVEAQEVFGGYAVLEVEDMNEAIALAKTWPGKTNTIEIRPLVDHSAVPAAH